MDYVLPINEQMAYIGFQTGFGLYTLLAAIVFGFILSFAVGANDSANSWGTPVGAKTVTLGIAFLFGSICESTGSIFLSQNVIDGISGDSSIIQMKLYQSDNTTQIDLFNHNNFDEMFVKEKTLMLGLTTSMVASQIWQLLATWFGWPVSGTHTIISSLMGFTIVENGPKGVNIGRPNFWKSSGIFKVIYGLVVAPMLGLFLGFAIYYPIYNYAVKSTNQKSWKCRLIYALCVYVIMMAITFFFVVMNVDPSEVPMGFSDEVTFGVVIGAIVGVAFAGAFACFHSKLIEMTGEFQFSLSFATELVANVRRTLGCSDTTTEETNITDDMLNDVSIHKSDEFKICSETGDDLTPPKRGNSTLEESEDDIMVEQLSSIEPTDNCNTTNEGKNRNQNGIAKDTNYRNTTETPLNYGTLDEQTIGLTNSGTKLLNEKLDNCSESDEVKRVFQPLQFLTACYAAINHGANDVANCIGPLVTAWMLYKTPLQPTHQSDEIIVLCWGAMGICLGLILYGQRVIDTMGKKICNMTPSMGFCVVLTSSILVMMASITGLPVSTTHCQVMGIVGASIAKGWVDSGSLKEGLNTFDMGLIRNIAMSWIITIPCAFMISVSVYAPARVLMIGHFGQ